MYSKLHEHWSTPYILKKYQDVQSFHDRFRSERHFWEKVGFSGMNVVDIGAASGGLYHALTERFGDVTYVGVDVSQELIDRGKSLAPEVTFIHGDVLSGIDPCYDGMFDVVVATGVFQHEPRYKELFLELFRYVKEGGYVLFDVKLFHTHPSISDIHLAYGDHGDHRVYFTILHIGELYNLFSSHPQAGSMLELFGYYSGVHATVHLPHTVTEEVCSAHVLIQRTTKKFDVCTVAATLPEQFLSSLFSR